LSLVQSSHARFFLSFNLRRSEPRAALQVIKRLSRDALDDELAEHAAIGVGACCYGLGRFEEARQAYEVATSFNPDLSIGWLYALNLSCLLTDLPRARRAGQALQVFADTPRVIEGFAIITAAAKELDPETVSKAKGITHQLGDKHPEISRRLCAAYSCQS